MTDLIIPCFQGRKTSQGSEESVISSTGSTLASSASNIEEPITDNEAKECENVKTSSSFQLKVNIELLASSEDTL